MSVVGSALEMPNSPEASISMGKRSYTRRFRVITNDRNDGPLIVLSAAGIPPLYTQYATPNESDPIALVRSYDPQRIGPAQLVWTVAVKYETPELKGGDKSGSGTDTPGEQNNPQLELPTVKTSESEYEELVTQVYDPTTNNAAPPASSAGEVFDPPSKRQNFYESLEISRNEDLSAPHPALGNLYRNSVNSDTFWGLAPGTWRCVQISAERQVRQLQNGTFVAFLKVTYKFTARPNGWDDQLLDYGNYYFRPVLDGAGDVTNWVNTQFKTADGHTRTGLLDGNGGALPDQAAFTVSGNLLTITAQNSNQLVYFPANLAVKVGAGAGGSLPTGLTAGTVYYALAPLNRPGPPATSTFSLSATPSGSAITLTGTGSGLLTVYPQPVFRTLRKYQWAAFGVLNLPQSFLEVQ